MVGADVNVANRLTAIFQKAKPSGEVEDKKSSGDDEASGASPRFVQIGENHSSS